MALTYSEPGALGTPAPDFSLPGVDGRTHRLSDQADAPAVVVVFMCNHCPYVIAVQDRINALAREYAGRGVRVLGINSNDPVKYPDDNFEAMRARATEQGYVFPYLQDATQETARAYGAVCTPDFYLLEPSSAAGQFVVSYRGRMDDNWRKPEAVKTRDLAAAIDRVLAGQPVPAEDQFSSMGCSIKWK
jgi:peroxiredoxin